jgi:hypothetical protein
VPVHFGFDGHPDRWSQKSWLVIYLVLLLAVGLGTLLHSLGWFMPRWLPKLLKTHPNLVNIPHKQQISELPPEKQQVIFGLIGEMMHVLAIEFIAFMSFIHWASMQVAQGKWQTIPVWYVFVFLGIIVLTFVYWFIHLNRTIKNMIG